MHAGMSPATHIHGEDMTDIEMRVALADFHRFASGLAAAADQLRQAYLRGEVLRPGSPRLVAISDLMQKLHIYGDIQYAFDVPK